MGPVGAANGEKELEGIVVTARTLTWTFDVWMSMRQRQRDSPRQLEQALGSICVKWGGVQAVPDRVSPG